ncbi:glycerol dehydratase reactivase beta/small subunit family protein [uncultured Cetobacterium sp.]|uniref:glycerol dehydratase reactivase beta/small subunit family protein n=1 Tax=uncultured Cetobacterium sp. TaxID=527638 RepID=UPI00262A57F6|nr:glycerol dehydratase reactivase beta/small subunit family protein [uncultured Cetobacterium sp.]
MTKAGIDIVCSNIIKINDIEDIFFGIEEEEIPYIFKFLQLEKINKDLYTNGRFEIGIGIDFDGEIVLNQKKYSKDFILKENIKSSKKKLRIFGQNAARILKGLPLKK